MRNKCGNSPYSVHQWFGNWILPHFDPLSPLEAKITPKWRTNCNYCHGCDFCGGCGGGLVVGVVHYWLVVVAWRAKYGCQLPAWHDQRLRTTTTSKYMGGGEFEGVKYENECNNTWKCLFILSWKQSWQVFFSSLSTASEIIHCLTCAFLLTK